MKLLIFSLVLILSLAGFGIDRVECQGSLQLEPDVFSLAEGRSRERYVPPVKDQRLPIVVVPRQYTLKSRPVILELTDVEIGNFTRFTAPGEISIDVDCVATSNTIVLHSYGATVAIHEDRVRLVEQGTNEALTIVKHSYDTVKDFYIIELSSETPVIFGVSYTLTIPYTTTMAQGETIVGHYLSFYTVPSTNETRYVSTTKFEPAHSRKAWPCFDEPSLKAPWKVSLGRKIQGNYHSLSNMPLVNTENDTDFRGWVWDNFENSVPISTYQVTCIVSDFLYNEADNATLNKPVRVYAAPHYIENGLNSGQYSATLVANILKHYQEHFQFLYPIPKMDSVSVPHFPSGAMEQFGLNTYKEEYILYYGENVNTEAERRRLSSVVAHELAHQHFGNLVTCEFWSDIWLNEGFATYVSFMGMNVTVPEFDPYNRHFIDATAVAMKSDQGPSTHPMHNDAQTPAEYSAVFSDISYEKGSSIIRMMEHVLTKSELDDGLRRYLNDTNLTFKSANQYDLFYNLEATSGTHPNLDGLTVREFLDTWTLQSGFPVVKVSSGGLNKIYLTQEKYIHDPQARENHKASLIQDLDPKDLWHVPVGIVTADNPDFDNNLTPKLIIKKNVLATSYSSNIDTTKWILVNPQAVGYYRVQYDQELTKNILAQLNSNSNVFPPITRSQLLDDHFNFAQAGYISISDALDFTNYLAQEDQLISWTTVWDHLRPVYLKLSDSDDILAFKTYFLSKINAALKLPALGGFKQPVGQIGTNVILRAILLDYAGALDDPETLAYANEEYENLKNDQNYIVRPDVQAVLYCAAVGQNDEAHTFFLNRYKASTERFERSRILGSLACTKNTALLNETLHLTADANSGILDTDRVLLMQRVAATRAGREFILPFLTNNYGKGYVNPSAFASVVGTMSTYVTSADRIDQVRAAIAQNADTLSTVMSSLNSSISIMEANVQWKETEAQEYIGYFNTRSS